MSILLEWLHLQKEMTITTKLPIALLTKSSIDNLTYLGYIGSKGKKF